MKIQALLLKCLKLKRGGKVCSREIFSDPVAKTGWVLRIRNWKVGRLVDFSSFFVKNGKCKWYQQKNMKTKGKEDTAFSWKSNKTKSHQSYQFSFCVLTSKNGRYK